MASCLNFCFPPNGDGENNTAKNLHAAFLNEMI